jgi:enterochelin esterase-like enzyme
VSDPRYGIAGDGICTGLQARRSITAEPAWLTPQVESPRVAYHTFDSTAAKSRVSFHLYTPAAYERDTEKWFPVVYWLHGSGGGLAGIPKVAAHFDAAIEAGKTPPCFIVFVNESNSGT